ncbi:hypothetical protein ILYODFUR_016930 [Ilyodon furcidens]|uniref:Uncharacterized protein n=1 Tax=Ilyodon furcidens TaxID=33524 RepID=A0ABV0TVR2_9TELE
MNSKDTFPSLMDTTKESLSMSLAQAHPNPALKVSSKQGGVLTGQQSFRDEPTSFYHFTQEERCSRNM